MIPLIRHAMSPNKVSTVGTNPIPFKSLNDPTHIALHRSFIFARYKKMYWLLQTVVLFTIELIAFILALF